MCTNRALVNSLECYMDDLVDCFEDFVKKSLVLISVGVGTVVVMLAYMLKVLTDTDRTGTPETGAADQRLQTLQRCQSNSSIQNTREQSLKQPNTIKSDIMLQYCEPKLACKSANTLPISVVPSFDERVLRDIRCNKNCELKKQTVRNCATSKISLSNQPTCLSRQYLSPPWNCLKELKRASCCSLCGDDEKRNRIS